MVVFTVNKVVISKHTCITKTVHTVNKVAYSVLNTYLFFLSGELCHPQLVLVLQFLRRLKLLQETQVVETLAVEELCLHHSHLLLAAVQPQVRETLVELAPSYIPHVVSG